MYYNCVSGHFCLNGTSYPTQYPCPPGTFNALEQGAELGDCHPCPGGEYCEGQGNAAPTGNCTEGWYCQGGADAPNTTTNGGRCQPGYYCPLGEWNTVKK